MTGAEIFKKTGVIGWPVNHSRSPLIHGYWLQHYKIHGSYEAVPIAPEGFRDSIRKLVDDGYAGFNVTVPHKQAIMDVLDFVRADAERIGAVNTVVVGPDGALEGRNTDAFGFIENLKATLDPDFDGPAVILGAGGAARAVIYALQNQGVKDIRIVNRTLARARDLAAHFHPATAHALEALPHLTRDATLIVNTTTLGMKGQGDLELDFTQVYPQAVVYDIVYTPLMTPLLTAARARGHRIVTGIGMLLHQARPAFQAWHGILPEVDATLLARVLA